MKELKELVMCTTPFMVSALMVYPFVAIMGGSTDPFAWERPDRVFYFICTVTFGWMLLARLVHAHKESV